MSDVSVDPAIEAHLQATREARLASYLDLIRIPSISALSEHAGDVRRAAEWVASELGRIGFEHVEVSGTAGLPVVYADWLHAEGAPTVLVYCHYDVQQVDPLELWDTAPFEPFVRDGRVVGRGAADDKSGVAMHLQAAEALFATRGRLPLNLRICFEGEEESTSPSLAAWLEANRDRLGADVAIVTDTGFFEGNIPAITQSIRGILYTQIEVTGPTVDLHSGSYGGNVENPANALARIIAELKDRGGVVQIPGFYDDVLPVDAATRSRMAATAFDAEAYRDRIGVPELAGEADYSPVEREGVRPTLDVNGIWGGFQGEGAKTIIPAHAYAKVSMRLVANQDPDRIWPAFREFVLRVAPPGVRVEVKKLGTGRPSATPIDHPLVQAAAAALEATFGRAPVFRRSGGSIPVAEMLERQLGLTVVLLGFTNPDDNAHAPNESMVLANYETGIRTLCLLWDLLGRNGIGGA